jgi:hypothetical protein
MNFYGLYFTIRYLDAGSQMPIGGMAPKIISQLQLVRQDLESLGLRFAIIQVDRIILDLTAT